MTQILDGADKGFKAPLYAQGLYSLHGLHSRLETTGSGNLWTRGQKLRNLKNKEKRTAGKWAGPRGLSEQYEEL